MMSTGLLSPHPPESGHAPAVRLLRRAVRVEAIEKLGHGVARVRRSATFNATTSYRRAAGGLQKRLADVMDYLNKLKRHLQSTRQAPKLKLCNATNKTLPEATLHEPF